MWHSFWWKDSFRCIFHMNECIQLRFFIFFIIIVNDSTLQQCVLYLINTLTEKGLGLHFLPCGPKNKATSYFELYK